MLSYNLIEIVYMLLNELQALFLHAFQTRPIYKPVLMDPGRPLSHYEHYMYSFDTLHVLIDELRALPADTSDEEDDQLNRFSVRFVVDVSGKMWFSREGQTGETVPNHVQMSRRCIAAGNMYFSPDYENIIKLTNKSGHFLPQAECLVWPVAILTHLGAAFSDTVELELIGESVLGDKPLKTTQSWTQLELQSCIPEDMNVADLITANHTGLPIYRSASHEPGMMALNSSAKKKRRIEWDAYQPSIQPVIHGGLFGSSMGSYASTSADLTSSSSAAPTTPPRSP